MNPIDKLMSPTEIGHFYQCENSPEDRCICDEIQKGWKTDPCDAAWDRLKEWQ